MKRETEVILLALDFYSSTRSGTAGAEETKALAQRIRIKSIDLVNLEAITQTLDTTQAMSNTGRALAKSSAGFESLNIQKRHNTA